MTSSTLFTFFFPGLGASEDTVMAKVQVLNVAVLDNPSPFGNPFQFEITFECMEDLPEGGYRFHVKHVYSQLIISYLSGRILRNS